MHAFDFILVLFSFVYAVAVTHLLSTAGEIIIATKRIQLSWFNAGWMLAALLFACAWWIGLWDLHAMTYWDIGSIAFNFSVAAGIYLYARLVSPRIPEQGKIDLQKFHIEEGRKYLIAYAVLAWVTVFTNAVLGQVNGITQWRDQLASEAHFKVPESRAFTTALAALAVGRPDMALFEAAAVEYKLAVSDC